MNLVELKSSEVKEIQGGGWIKDLWEVFKELDEKWDEYKERFKNGYNSCKCK